MARNLTLKVFKSGNSAALRLPKELGFEPGEELHATVEGDSLVIRPMDPDGWPKGYFESWEALSPAFEVPARRAAGTRTDRLERLFAPKKKRG